MLLSLNISSSFLAFILTCLSGKKIGNINVMRLAVGSASFSTFLALLQFNDTFCKGNTLSVDYGTWVHVDNLSINWRFALDNLNVFMLCIITAISLAVHIYSCAYLAQEAHIIRYLSYISFFSFCMKLLVLADNYLIIFIGWEGVGLCSYLLISFWNTRTYAAEAALKAMLINRISDLGFILALLLLFDSTEALDFFTIYSSIAELLSTKINIQLLPYTIQLNQIDIICMLLFFAAMGKSAQLGLHIWLPDAMEGPTPVSALIHAATMVTAGVFLIIRSSFLFEKSPIVKTHMLLIGSLTTFLGATAALQQNDIKKIVAFSTVSQLGYMFLACGLSNYVAALFHLVNHAFFKALLFLAAGSFIHTKKDQQDWRSIKVLRTGTTTPTLIIASIFIGNLALAGFPATAGWYSKELIIETGVFFNTNNNMLLSLFGYFFGSLSAILTAAYAGRMLFLTAWKVNLLNLQFNLFKYFKKDLHQICFKKIKEQVQFVWKGKGLNDADIISSFVLLCLCFCSVFIGFFLNRFLHPIYFKHFNDVVYINTFYLNTNYLELIPKYKFFVTTSKIYFIFFLNIFRLYCKNLIYINIYKFTKLSFKSKKVNNNL